MPPGARSIAVALCSASVAAGAQQLSRIERERGVAMLRDLRRDIEKHYYDPTYRGRDLAAHFAKAEETVKSAPSVSHMLAAISQAVDDLGDSHTFFIPPDRNVSVEYGWTMMAVGRRVLISSVTPGSDAARQGLSPGDELLQLNTAVPSRQNVSALTQYYRIVRPQKQQHLRVRTPAGVERELDIASAVVQRRFRDFDQMIRELERAERSMRHRDRAIATDLLVWRMPAFLHDDSELDRLVKKARGFKTLILDLRDNGGGSVDTLLELIGRLFDRDVTIGTLHERSGTKPFTAKAKQDPFGGRLIVLVDSRSASAAEIAARVVQVEQRATVVGDRTAGMVMGSEVFSHAGGGDSPFFYGISVTVTDLTMADGTSLEGHGVTPDALVLPSPADLAAGRDPVLATAARLAGATLTPDEAGKLFPAQK